MSKLHPLIMLVAAVFLCTFLDAAYWPEHGNRTLRWAESVLIAIGAYWWYHLDKSERGFRAGIVQNAGVAVITIVALPVYLVRSRGWRKGIVAISRAAAFTLVLFLFVLSGYLIGRHVAF